ncbi:hypothetical protein PPL_01165 [Heterostelium album PN500]|uniref:Uncharacterized protein n=1 Tax=Heterostelium pallidum (strain ATCC 26659 / Pp 5 / PN500) TaxID=670386 RepID=D3AYA5_HETP5|nr:hypothetical protein PPL_01165 [Heterostelium album PN500]EFA85932.1 hypothetical protein PPL_01165 [Heterostelium album PN500]|eukprot:XP_020438038.1 hypothetical protein PPL_01165 [Heterostelium album PN500]
MNNNIGKLNSNNNNDLSNTTIPPPKLNKSNNNNNMISNNNNDRKMTTTSSSSSTVVDIPLQQISELQLDLQILKQTKSENDNHRSSKLLPDRMSISRAESKDKNMTNIEDQQHQYDDEEQESDKSNIENKSNIRRKIDDKVYNIQYIEKKEQPLSIPSSLTYHQRIMDVYHKEGLESQQLLDLVENIDYKLFSQLQEESIEIILPIILKFQTETIELHLIAISLIVLWMMFEKFPHFFSKRKYTDIMSQFNYQMKQLERTSVIEDLKENHMFPFTNEEYNLLKNIIDK